MIQRKKRVSYHAKKRLVKDLNTKEKYNARLIWRLRKKTQRDKNRNIHQIIDITPPNSPLSVENETNYNLNNVVEIQRNNSPALSQGSSVSQKEKGRKQVKRDRSKLYRDNLKLK